MSQALFLPSLNGVREPLTGSVEPLRPASADALEALVRRCAGGDRTALREIYDREASRLVGVACRIVRDRAVAEDVVHDVFVKIWTKAATFDPARGSALAWIVSITRYRALNVIRGSKRVTEIDDTALARLPDQGPDPLAELSRLREGDALRRCLETLDDDKKRAILLAFVDGFSHAEISAGLKIPLGTVKSWIRRGLLALKGCLE